MTNSINIAKGLTAEISIIDGMVFITTNYNNVKRSTSYDSVNDAINQTTIKAISIFLQSI